MAVSPPVVTTTWNTDERICDMVRSKVQDEASGGVVVPVAGGGVVSSGVVGSPTVYQDAYSQRPTVAVRYGKLRVGGSHCRSVPTCRANSTLPLASLRALIRTSLPSLMPYGEARSQRPTSTVA